MWHDWTWLCTPFAPDSILLTVPQCSSSPKNAECDVRRMLHFPKFAVLQESILPLNPCALCVSTVTYLLSVRVISGEMCVDQCCIHLYRYWPGYNACPSRHFSCLQYTWLYPGLCRSRERIIRQHEHRESFPDKWCRSSCARVSFTPDSAMCKSSARYPTTARATSKSTTRG